MFAAIRITQLLPTRQLQLSLFIAIATVTVTFLQSCKDNAVVQKQPLVITQNYDSTAFVVNTTAELLAQRGLQLLTAEVKKGRVNGTKLQASVLTSLYRSIEDGATPYYRSKMSNYFMEIEKASGGMYNPKLAPNQNGEGGTFGGYLFDENGLEIEQQIEKGSLVSVLYNQAQTLMQQPMSVANVDKIVLLFGAKPAFANTDNAVNPNSDVHTAAYAARRDKNDGNGFYTGIKKALLTAQSAAKAGTAYQDEYNSALKDVRILWEKALMATVINYCHSAKANFIKTSPTDAELASALHAYGEIVGFIHGWKTVSNKKITDEQIDTLLVLLLAPSNGTPTSYRFVQDAFNTAGNFDQIISQIATLYGFTTQDVEDFKSNWVSVQQRK